MRVDKKRDADSPRTCFFKTVPTEREAKALERKIKHEMETGVYFEPSDLTVAEYLRSWHKVHARHHTSPRALESNGYMLEAHIIPAWGRLKLAKLRPTHLQSYYSETLDSGLAASSVRKHHNMIHAALKHAVRMQLLATNPAAVVVPPRVVRGKMTAWDEKQAAAMLRAAAGTSLHMPLLLALGTGMRRGELLGLRWPNVDLEAGPLVVSQTLQEAYGELHFKGPKTAKSRRRIKKKQGLACRLHDLRHTHATQLLKAGVHPKVVSERLGHASIGITLDTYSHVMPGMQEEAAEKIDAGLRAALTK